MILSLTEVILDKIGRLLSAKDLLRLGMTCRSLNNYFNKEFFWQKLMTENFWIEKLFSTCQADIKFLLNNSPNHMHETFDFDSKTVKCVVYSHNGTLEAVFANECYLWIFREDYEIYYINLSRKRMWNTILTVAFSPDDNHFLVTGIVNRILGGGNGRETLIYKIKDDHVTMISWIVLENQMTACWFDNTNILYMSNEQVENRIRMFISSINNAEEIMVYPILTFNKQVMKIMVAQEVSPRTRKVVQIANQASDEGKTLAEKLMEIGNTSGIDTSDMTTLKAILDQNEECMPCYKLHAHHNSVQAAECECECHHNTDKLLIFYGNGSLVHAKVITKKMLDDAKMAFNSRGEYEHSDHHRLFFPLAACTNFDSLDYTFSIPGSLINNDACFSLNYRYLYVTSTEPTSATCSSLLIRVTCLDLATMTVKKDPGFSSHQCVGYYRDVKITSNKHFVTIVAGNQIFIYSALHQGKVVDVITEIEGMITSVALHPYLNKLLVSNESLLYSYCCAEDNRPLEDE